MKKIILFLLIAGVTTAQSFKLEYNARLNKNKLANVESNLMPVQKFEKKKVGLAVLYSLLLPGMGELYAGSYESGKYFTIGDVALWGTLTGFALYGKWEENNYKAFAKVYGGVNPEGKDDKYYANIGNYISVYEYNRDKLLYRQFNKTYDEQKFYWQWMSQSQRREYRGMWKASENAYNAIRFVVGAMILNRVASAINAIRLVNKHNRKIEGKEKVGLRFGVENVADNSSSLTLYLNFSF